MVTTPHPEADGGTPRHERPSHVADLLRLITRDPGRPRLTWYGDDGERVELSAAVLENWVNKTTNLLVEEFDAQPGARVVLDLPVHWRTVVWALAVWRVGATVVLVPGDRADAVAEIAGSRPDVVVSTRPAVWTGSGAELVAVALPALARRFDGDLPPGAVDSASAVMTYGDQVGWVPAVELARPALEAGAAEPVPHGALVPAAREGGVGRRVLVDGRGPTGDVLRGLLAVYGADGSAVVLSAATAVELDDDAARRDRVLAGERVDDDPR
jgi:uncharacterized protein (TIGR03089 family)